MRRIVLLSLLLRGLTFRGSLILALRGVSYNLPLLPRHLSGNPRRSQLHRERSLYGRLHYPYRLGAGDESPISTPNKICLTKKKKRTERKNENNNQQVEPPYLLRGHYPNHHHYQNQNQNEKP